MKTTEQKYMDKLEQQAVVAIGLLYTDKPDGWTKKMYRERMDKINAETCELNDAVNNRHKRAGDCHA